MLSNAPMQPPATRQKRRLSDSRCLSGSIDVVLPILSRVRITASDRGLTGLAIVPGNLRDEAVLTDCRCGNSRLVLLEEAARQLVAWFAKKRTAFDLPLDLRGTAFQRGVWDALARIPYGTTRTYGELARDVGRPGAARAVGQAAAANPLPIVIPCHRLVAQSGLGGFSLGNERDCGADAPCRSPSLKKKLIDFETG